MTCCHKDLLQLENRNQNHVIERIGEPGISPADEDGDVPELNAKGLNKNLLDHFRVLAASNEDTDQVDLPFLHGVLTDGADQHS
ncbi:hypothetical protein AALO_G00228880 [Alosa alosa]|uniref:Uncharacterized protein n=1 Tax=Alosa alosa TaxID=278164 RepID=A0AAV6FWU6_9TELE|nr:hypothetical protein AALO_G00228880 [Alosa alosa]